MSREKVLGYQCQTVQLWLTSATLLRSNVHRTTRRNPSSGSDLREQKFKQAKPRGVRIDDGVRPLAGPLPPFRVPEAGPSEGAAHLCSKERSVRVSSEYSKYDFSARRRPASWTPCRCHAATVSGLTMTRADRQPVDNLENQTH